MPALNKKLYHYIIKGKVQGVGFRYFTKEQAEQLSLSGWVKNLADGSVETVASGDENTLTEFKKKLNQGPPLSRVDSIIERDISLQNEIFHCFDIRH